VNIGYDHILKMRRVEKEADELGFMFAYPKHRWNGEETHYIALRPKDADSLPIYSRDAQFFTGTLDDIENFIAGIKWSRDYDYMLKVSDNKKRLRKEQDVRNKNLMDKLREDPLKKVES
jgi:hypothetical protein